MSRNNKIDDFGEVIEGARKDVHAAWSELMQSNFQEGLNISQPLSKIWPEPNYNRLNYPEPVKRWLRALRDELGSKPGRYRMHTWPNNLTFLYGAAHHLINKEWPADIITDHVTLELHNYAKAFVAQRSWNENSVTALLVQASLREKAYERWGMDKSLKQFGFAYRPSQEQHYYAQIRESQRTTGRYYQGRDAYELLDNMVNDPMIQALLNPASNRSQAATPKKPRVILGITYYRNRPDRGFSISVKHHGSWLNLMSFDSSAEANAYLKDADKHQALIDQYLAWRETPNERANANSEREGLDWRQGKDVTSEQFMEAFAFRGVQFGNYVENTRRQQELNETYDALMDMAWVLDVDPKALSLDSTLGLAFGARGRGGKDAPNAHYEPAQRVINLTKSRGAGSLAHEWFHAFDHYIMEQLKAGLNRPERYVMLTEYFGERLGVTCQEENAKRMTKLALGYGDDKAGQFEAFKQGLVDFSLAYNVILDRSKRLDEKRSKPYWATHAEVGARTFESMIQTRLKNAGHSNDYLVNILSEKEWKATELIEGFLGRGYEMNENDTPNDYPYPLDAEKEEVAIYVTGLFQSMRQHSQAFQEKFDLNYMPTKQVEQEAKDDDLSFNDWEFAEESISIPRKQIQLF